MKINLVDENLHFARVFAPHDFLHQTPAAFAG